MVALQFFLTPLPGILAGDVSPGDPILHFLLVLLTQSLDLVFDPSSSQIELSILATGCVWRRSLSPSFFVDDFLGGLGDLLISFLNAVHSIDLQLIRRERVLILVSDCSPLQVFDLGSHIIWSRVPDLGEIFRLTKGVGACRENVVGGWREGCSIDPTAATNFVELGGGVGDALI